MRPRARRGVRLPIALAQVEERHRRAARIRPVAAEDGERAVERGAGLDVCPLLRAACGGRAGGRQGDERDQDEGDGAAHGLGSKQLGRTVTRVRACVRSSASARTSASGRRRCSEALDRLGAEEGIGVVAVSTFRETDPVGVLDQPRFVNAAAELETSLAPRELLQRLLEVERSLGRDRTKEERWGPRTIDLDLLLYGDEEIAEPGLTVPHPRLAERAFVLEPLLELDPGLRLPDGRALRELHAPELE